MNNDFVILTDSSCDLPPALAESLGIVVLPLTLTLDGREYANDLEGREIGFADFYRRLRDGGSAVTAAANPDRYLALMDPILRDGKDLLLLVFSSGLSSTCQSALVAVEEMQEKYPQRRILAVDTLCASMGQGLLVTLAARRRAAGASIEELRDWALEARDHLCHWFTVDDLMFLKRGGRLGAATALVGTALGIKPVLHVNEAGKLVSVGKARGRQAAIAALVDRMAETAATPVETVFISHGDCPDDAKTLEKLVRQRFSPKEVVISYVGPVIGAHSGPGTLALFYLGSTRRV